MDRIMANFPMVLGGIGDYFTGGYLLIIVCAAVAFFIGIGIFKWLLGFYRKVEQGKALIINKTRGNIDVSFTGGLVLPVLHLAEVMDLSVKKIEIDRRGKEGLICKDNIRADITVAFFVRVNPTQDDVKKVAQSIGCARASAQETLEQLFNAKFSEALKTVGKLMQFIELYENRENFRERIIEVIGKDLNGYFLEDCAIDYLEQTPLESLDKENILDAEGIKKITQLTVEEHIQANKHRRREDKEVTEENVRTRETILELERAQAQAELEQKKEIEVIRAEQEAESAIKAAEQRRQSEMARIEAEKEIAKSNEVRERDVAVAAKDKERAIAVENENVERARQKAAIDREREVTLLAIEKEKAVEVEKKNIQDVIRQRVAVEKTVAVEEENIKDVRAIATAERGKKVAITAAEQHAQEALVKDIKAAEAQEIAAKHLAAQEITMAQAELAKSEKLALAKMKMAEGVAAEAAAEGLAKVRVKEADADATEKMGKAEAVAIREKGKASADANKDGRLAEATGIEAEGLAKAKARTADAAASKEYYLAEAEGIREKALAEAEGIDKKADAMKQLDERTISHEEFRIGLDVQKQIDNWRIHAGKAIGMEQAKVLGEAMKNAKFDIVGGDGEFFDRFVSAIGAGKSLDAFVDRSEVVQKLGKEYLNGDGNFMEDLKEILVKANLGTEDLKNISITALLTKLMAGATDDDTKSKLARLLAVAEDGGKKKGRR